MTSARQTFLEGKYRRPCLAAIGNIQIADRYGGSEDDAWASIVAMDPTPTKRYLQWLCRLVGSGRLKPEDFYKAPDLLRELQRCGPVLKRAGVSRDVNGYDGLAPLARALSAFQSKKTMGESHREHRALVDTEWIVHHRCDKLIVIEPKTERASCYWGRGTQWCTAATDSHNAFDYYTEGDGKLVIYLHADGAKYQGAANGELADENDEHLDWTQLPEEQLNVMIGTPALRELLFMLSSDALQVVPRELWTESGLLHYIARHPQHLSRIPMKRRSRQICETAVRGWGGALVDVPEHLRTPDICVMAVRGHQKSLEAVPRNVITQSMCDEAVFMDPAVISRVPSKFLTPRLIKLAVISDWGACKSLPPEAFTAELVGYLLTIDAKSISVIPENLIPDGAVEMCVRRDASAIKHVPKNQLTEDLCRLAVAKDWPALMHIPPELRTPDLCRLAVETNGEALGLMSKAMITAELCEMAVAKTPSALRHVPHPLITPSVIADAISANGRNLAYVPAHLRDADVCRSAVTQNGFALEFVPDPTPAICRAAIQSNGLALRFVPKHLVTPELCAEAVAHYPEAIGWVPEALRTSEMYESAVAAKVAMIHVVPPSKMTVGMLLTVFEKIPDLHIFSAAYGGRDGEALVPDQLARDALARGAILPIHFIPKDLQSVELCVKSLRKFGAVCDITEAPTLPGEVYLEAILAGALHPKHVPKALWAYEYFEAGFMEKGVGRLANVPERFKTFDMCALAIRHSSDWSLKDLPQHLRSEAYCLQAVSLDARELQQVPLPLRTAELCSIAVRQDPQTICHVPPHVELSLVDDLDVQNESTLALARQRRGMMDIPF